MKILNKKGSIDKTLVILLIIVFTLFFLVVNDYLENDKIGQIQKQELSKEA
ncbi:MAG: hypothetical protein ACQERD_03140 [Campylobacterota bacterium]